MNLRRTLRRIGVASIVVTSLLVAPSLTSAAPQQSSGTEIMTKSDWLKAGGVESSLSAVVPLSGVKVKRADEPTLREECQNNADAAKSAKGWWKNRNDRCFHEHHDLVLVRKGTVQKLGRVIFDEWIFVFNSMDKRRVDYVASVEDIWVEQVIGGPEPSTWSIDMQFLSVVQNGPSAGLTRPTTEGRNDLLGAWNERPSWTLTYTSDENLVPDDGKFVTANIRVELSVTAPGAEPWKDQVRRNADVRFDSAGTGSMRVRGTIFSDVRSVFSLSLSDDAVKESARHIDDALHHPERTFPSWLGKNIPGETTPLHREMDTKKQDENNRLAKATCIDVWGSYEGQVMNCDEYPFKATKEGAAYSNGNYSSRLIDKTDNQIAGNLMLQHFGSDRVHNGEAFYVNIRP